MYKAYLKEREDLETLECDAGFATYKIFGNICYLQDIYVLPERRKQGVASLIANKVCEIAKNHGCQILIGSTDSNANASESSSKALLAYGLIPYQHLGSMTYYRKEI